MVEVLVGTNRFNGQKSSSKSANGRVTAIGLDISAQANKTSASRYMSIRGFLTYFTYAIIVSSQKKALNTSLRSDAHATDSTCNGCQPKNAATNALGQILPVICFNKKNTSNVLAVWNNTFVK